VVLARRPQRFGDMSIFGFAAKGLASVASGKEAFLTDVFLKAIARQRNVVA
jgi:hypothetical protein